MLANAQVVGFIPVSSIESAPLRYGFFEQDVDGVWMAPDGSKVAWFNDPDGNLLSISQHARERHA